MQGQFYQDLSINHNLDINKDSKKDNSKISFEEFAELLSQLGKYLSRLDLAKILNVSNKYLRNVLWTIKNDNPQKAFSFYIRYADKVKALYDETKENAVKFKQMISFLKNFLSLSNKEIADLLGVKQNKLSDLISSEFILSKYVDILNKFLSERCSQKFDLKLLETTKNINFSVFSRQFLIVFWDLFESIKNLSLAVKKIQSSGEKEKIKKHMNNVKSAIHKSSLHLTYVLEIPFVVVFKVFSIFASEMLKRYNCEFLLDSFNSSLKSDLLPKISYYKKNSKKRNFDHNFLFNTNIDKEKLVEYTRQVCLFFDSMIASFFVSFSSIAEVYLSTMKTIGLSSRFEKEIDYINSVVMRTQRQRQDGICDTEKDNDNKFLSVASMLSIYQPNWLSKKL